MPPLVRRQLVLDLLSVHLIRNVDSSVIISFHPTLDHPITKADFLHDRIRFAGEQAIFSILLVLMCCLPRSKRVLAENIPSFTRSHFRPSGLHMAHIICMG